MPINTDVQAAARSAIEEMVHRETRAWDQQDADAMVDLFHPDMVWPRPPTAQDHDPESWLLPMRRFDRDRWKRSWEQLFAMHRLVHNRRALRKVMVSAEGDGGARALEPARCFESLSLPSLPSHPLVEQEGAAQRSSSSIGSDERIERRSGNSSHDQGSAATGLNQSPLTRFVQSRMMRISTVPLANRQVRTAVTLS